MAQQSFDRLYPGFVVHVFKLNAYLHLNAGITDLNDLAGQFDNGSRRDGVLEVNSVGRDGHHFLAAESGCGYKSCFVHPLQSCAAEEGVVMVCGVGEDGLSDFGD